MWRRGPVAASWSLATLDKVSVLSTSRLFDVIEGVCEPAVEAVGDSLNGSEVMFEPPAASFSFPVTASEAARKPRSFLAFCEAVHGTVVVAAGEGAPLITLGDDREDRLSSSRLVTVGDGAMGDLWRLRLRALAERKRPL